MANFSDLVPEVVFEAVETLGGRCTGRLLGLNAMENRVYDVGMEEGPNRVVKFYRPGRWSKEVIQSEHNFLTALETNEVPVVCALANDKKETVFEKAGLYFAVFPKKSGRLEPELRPEQLKRLGRFLARIHNTGEAFPKVPRPALSTQTYGRDVLQYLNEQKLIPGTFGINFGSLVNRICDAVEPIAARFPSILLHGDCHAGNVLWNSDEPFFIDFDDIVYAPPVQDIWMLTGAGDEYGKEMREILLTAYEEIRAFNWESLCLIESLRALRMIYFTMWIARRWDDGAFKLAFPYFGTERYWQDQIEGLSVQYERIVAG